MVTPQQVRTFRRQLEIVAMQMGLKCDVLSSPALLTEEPQFIITLREPKKVTR